ncbi:uncharacterized protein [Diabrotica undecimpunctata]|uniref:uncharacterized protein n=1 Tax=Diabrotica undecimpunctata TaxID=50387 RepID=UPI003B639145
MWFVCLTVCGYTYGFNVYYEKEHAEGSSVLTNVVAKLMDGLLEKGQTLAIGNYYSSVTLSHELQNQKTLRANLKYNLKNVISKKLKVGKHVAGQSNSGIVVQKWRDKQYVLMISTKFAEQMGHILAFIQNFLTHRHIEVRANGYNSSPRSLENGIPQGSILSPPLFLIAINNILDEMRLPNKANLYADDLIIYHKSRSVECVAEVIQKFLHTLEKWSLKTGFNFFPEKTQYIIFSKRKNIKNINLTLNGHILKETNEINCLGLTLDCTLNWKSHIHTLQKQCQPRINLLKILSNRMWGADTRTLLNLYQSLIRSKLDYGSICYGTAKKTTLKKLNSIQSTSLRIALCAFRTSPSNSLQVLANELPLHLRRQQLSLNYATRVSSNHQNPMHSNILKPKCINNYKNKPMNTLPFHERIKFSGYDCEQFSAIINPTQNSPSWSTGPPIVNTSLTRYPKTSTNPTLIHQSYHKIISLYPNSEHIYTDALKTQSRLAAAYIYGADYFKIRLPPSYSIFTGEALAILEALKVCRRKSAPHDIIISDSLSTLKALQQLYPSNEIIMLIKNELILLSTNNIEITFLWVPSHVGIKGNEAMDQLANEAALDESIPVLHMLTRNDHKTSIKRHINNLWQSNWNSTSNKLKDVIETVGTTLPLPPKRCEQGDDHSNLGLNGDDTCFINIIHS